MERSEKRISELKRLFIKIYEDNASGKLSDERFDMMSQTYEAEQKELEAKFGGSCSSEDLKRYEDNANKLAALYDEYFELNEE